MKLPSLTVRQRISVAVALLVTAALVAVGVTVNLVETRRITASVETNITQEFDEFRRFGVTLATDERLTFFLQSNLPGESEVLWAFKTDGSVQFVGSDVRELQAAGTFPTAVRDLMETGGVTDFKAGNTTYRLGVLPIHDGDDRAALAVTVNTSTARAELNELLVTYALLSAFSLMAVVGFSSIVAGRSLAPLRDLRDTARRISSGTVGERITVTGRDDIADLQHSFNTMLDRLEGAMRAQRDMLDDAAHELRTPLTVIRGQLEVVDPDDPADVDETRAVVMDEVDRMSRLVSDLLVLAKSGRTDFVIAEPTDVGVMVESVLARARTLADRDWTIESHTNAVVALDQQRIVQALLQLADNAVKHTEPGDVIALGGTIVGTGLELWVRDTGTGVSDDDRERIFDRFAQSANEREGFGLGLSIVTAIADAHGGRVTLDPTDPASPGATFRLHIPIGGPV